MLPTLGEKSLEESLASLRAQTIRLKDIVIVRNTTPFPEAMNRGVAKVTTPFLIQCDADMVLHPDCVETLLACMDQNTGVSLGYLHDDMLGEIQAVKMYRTECLRNHPFEDTVASDTDGIARIVQSGFGISFAHRKAPRGSYANDVLGEHRPAYDNSLYVYEKFLLMGSIVRNRNSYLEYSGVLAALRRSPHKMSDLAITAFCHGVFNKRRTNGHKPFEETRDYRFFSDFRSQKNNGHNLFAITKLAGYDRAAELADLHANLPFEPGA